jgi:hypothetical protein
MLQYLILFFLSLCLAAQPALAQNINTHDADILRRAYQAGDAGDWDEGVRIAKTAKDPLILKIALISMNMLILLKIIPIFHKKHYYYAVQNCV